MEPIAEKDAVEHDLWWGYLCPALANIGALKEAQRDLVALGADWAEAGRILSRVQSFYVDAAHGAAQRYVAAQTDAPHSEARTEYALAAEVRPGRFTKVVGLTADGRWNETYDAQYAIEHWYPGAVVVTRTVTVFEAVVTEWTRVLPPVGKGQADA